MNPMPHEEAGSQVPSVPRVMPWNSERLSHESLRRSVEAAPEIVRTSTRRAL